MNKKPHQPAYPKSQDERIIVEKKSNLQAANVFDFMYLIRTTPGLIPCRYEETEEELTFTFTMSGLSPLPDLKKEPLVSQYRFLANIRSLQTLYDSYECALSEDNLFYDGNFMPHVLRRDILLLKEATAAEQEQRFLAEYQKLAVGVLSRKYSVKQVRESGLEIVRRDKNAAPLLRAGTTTELSQHLEERWLALNTANKTAKRLVDKNRQRFFRFLSIGTIIVLLTGVLYTGYQVIFVLPLQAAVINASKDYVLTDYPGCVEALRAVEPEQMDNYTKYILAVSYAKNEMLTAEEINNIIGRLNINSNEIEFDYWIYLGRYEVARAQNIARALSDDKLLVYAYMKEINLLENNITIDGTEKQSRLEELNNEITAIGEKYLEE